MEIRKRINGITVIHYTQTPQESLQAMGQAMKTKERLQRELVKPVSKKRMQNAYRELLEITERYDLSKRSNLNYK